MNDQQWVENRGPLYAAGIAMEFGGARRLAPPEQVVWLAMEASLLERSHIDAAAASAAPTGFYPVAQSGHRRAVLVLANTARLAALARCRELSGPSRWVGLELDLQRRAFNASLAVMGELSPHHRESALQAWEALTGTAAA